MQQAQACVDQKLKLSPRWSTAKHSISTVSFVRHWSGFSSILNNQMMTCFGIPSILYIQCCRLCSFCYLSSLWLLYSSFRWYWRCTSVMGNRLRLRYPSHPRQHVVMSSSSAKSPVRAAAIWLRSGEAMVRPGGKLFYACYKACWPADVHAIAQNCK